MTLRFSPQTRRVFHLSLPIFAELLLQLLVGNMDQFMISHFGSAAVAAIGNGNQVMNVVIIVLTTISIPGKITAEAALSFLGVGVPPPTPSVRNAARSSPWPLRSAPYSAFWWACSCF